SSINHLFRGKFEKSVTMVSDGSVLSTIMSFVIIYHYYAFRIIYEIIQSGISENLRNSIG
ncbi:MAG TPA: hypothetical protein PKK94_19020, partial [Leptospiraceae bacterium]|nr:hypothetical protein [Leptospiraceae bacterium]